MLVDALLSFVPIGAPLSLVTGGTGDVASTQIVDLAGSGSGTPPGGGNIIGTATTFGTDQGIGAVLPLLNVTVGTAFTTSAAGTLNIKLQAAVDTAVTYVPGTWVTLGETGAIAAASLTAGLVTARYPLLPAVPPSTLPRYLRLLFTIATGAMTAGTISSALITMVRDDQSNKFQASNFSV